MSRYQSRNPLRCAERYVARLPQVYGLFRERTWRATFRQTFPPRRDEIIVGLAAYLEETRGEWEAALAEKSEREQADWEQTERERIDREQAEWERTQIPETPPEPPLDPAQFDEHLEGMENADGHGLTQTGTDEVAIQVVEVAEQTDTDEVAIQVVEVARQTDTDEVAIQVVEEAGTPVQEMPPETAVGDVHAEQTAPSGPAS
jgi:hypothetical protein